MEVSPELAPGTTNQCSLYGIGNLGLSTHRRYSDHCARLRTRTTRRRRLQLSEQHAKHLVRPAPRWRPRINNRSGLLLTPRLRDSNQGLAIDIVDRHDCNALPSRHDDHL